MSPHLVTTSDIHGNEYHVSSDQLAWRPSAYGIVIKDGALLLSPQNGKLQLPGGSLDLSESPEEAVIREMKEETGATVTNPRLVGCMSGFFSYEYGGALHHAHSLLLYYRCDLVDETFTLNGLEEDEKPVVGMPEWLEIEKLDTITPGSTVDWRPMVHKALQG